MWVINNCDKTDINADRILVEIDIFLYWSNWDLGTEILPPETQL